MMFSIGTTLDQAFSDLDMVLQTEPIVVSLLALAYSP